MKTDELFETAIACILIALSIIFATTGAVMYSDGSKADDPFNMINGMAIMILVLIVLFHWEFSRSISKKDEEIEELKTNLALLQNRCDWLEDDICKEYRKETYPHNIEEDLP